MTRTSQSSLSPDLWNQKSRTVGSPPPSYDDSVADLPPDYTDTNALAFVQTPEYTPFPSLNASICSDVPNCLRLSRDTSPSSSLFLDEKSVYVEIDFGFDESGIKSHAKKNKKAAAKKPAASNAIDDSSNKPEEAPAGGDGGGGDPPADGGAGGGDGGDGGSGGDDAGKKGKKKSKKDKEEEERLKKEEEERLKKEEEDRLAKEEEERLAKEAEEEAERKKKEEEEAAAAAAAAVATSASADLSWANDAPKDDDWGSFAATAVPGKKKKGKKGKVRNLGYVMTPLRALM